MAVVADFDKLWDALVPREQARDITLLVAQIEFDPTGSAISVTFHPTASRGRERWLRAT
jgi:hypothetical protein